MISCNLSVGQKRIEIHVISQSNLCISSNVSAV